MYQMRVLITRPKGQSQPLIDKLKKLNVGVISFPTIEITDIDANTQLQEVISDLSKFDKVIFLSANAVQSVFTAKAPLSSRAKRGIWARQILHEIPRIARNDSFNSLQVFAVGKATAQKLEALGIKAEIPDATSFSSEGLLSLPGLQRVRDEKIIIFCGENPRPLLSAELSKRGAKVTVVPVYRRQMPEVNMLPLLTDWQHKGLDIIISTSGESLENLLSMVGNSGREWLLNQQLLVISERVATLAKQLGFKRSALVAKSASDDEIVAMICKT